MRQAGEPSVEEILSSIKKVIARDARIDSPRAGGARLARGHDVLDLSEVAAQVLGAAPVADAPGEPDTGEDEGEGALISEQTTAAMRDSLAALAMLSQPGARPQIVRSGETSLEGLVREMLRPMLADWLDQHLPAMVEQMVATEIARIVQKKA
jgi:cell pole-organizing protein PopZ